MPKFAYAFKAIAAVFFLNIAIASPAQAITGNELKTWCESSKDSDLMACIWYIAGVADATDAISSFLIQAKTASRPLYCTPENVTYKQTAEIVFKYMTNHPEVLHNLADEIVLTALAKTFPCDSAH